jgi:hypothetical protein
MMRAAAALIAAAVILQGCPAIEEEPDSIFLASLSEFAKEFAKEDKDPRMPLCATLSGLQPAARRSFAFIQPEPPPGFGDLADRALVEGPLSLEPLRKKLPRPWFMQDDPDELCFQFTRPATRGARAVVTGAFSVGSRDIAGTWNFWLRREGGRWRVVASTTGNHDI